MNYYVINCITVAKLWTLDGGPEAFVRARTRRSRR
jgi:hypothetical protein